MKAHFFTNDKLKLCETTTTIGALHCNGYETISEEPEVEVVKRPIRTRKNKILMKAVK